jgi:hypothetical protein
MHPDYLARLLAKSLVLCCWFLFASAMQIFGWFLFASAGQITLWIVGLVAQMLLAIVLVLRKQLTDI